MNDDSPFDTHAARYESWFEQHEHAYVSELNAVRSLIPAGGEAVEIGVGTGRFAVPLGIRTGLEPSEEMREIARSRGVEVIDGVAERMPFEGERFDVALMVTTLCFLNDAKKSFKEAYRVLRHGGAFIVGFVDLASPLGARYERHREESVFYRHATFYTVDEVIALYEQAGFVHLDFAQTLFHELEDISEVEPVRPGYGEGAFVVIQGWKP